MDGDFPALGAVYIVTIIIVGQFFLLNLILAVIIQAFINIQKKELETKIDVLNSTLPPPPSVLQPSKSAGRLARLEH